MSSTTASSGTICSEPGRIDDWYLRFPEPCAVSSVINTVLLVIWLLIALVAILEVWWSRYRKNRGNTPVSLQFMLYHIWVFCPTLLAVYLLAVPNATVTNFAQSTVLQTLMQLVFASSEAYTVVSTVRISHMFLNSALLVLSTEQRIKEEKILKWLSRLIWCWFFFSFVYELLLVVILPVVFYSNAQLYDNLTSSGYVLHGFYMLACCVIITVQLERLRSFVLALRRSYKADASMPEPEPESPDKTDSIEDISPNRNLSTLVQLSPGAFNNKQDRELKALTKRIRFLTAFVLIPCSISVAVFYLVTPAIGMRYWIIHVQYALNAGIILASLVSLYRPEFHRSREHKERPSNVDLKMETSACSLVVNNGHALNDNLESKSGTASNDF